MTQYIEIGFKLTTNKVYGLGERISDLDLNAGKWDMFAQYQPYVYDNGKGGRNIGGQHPVLVS